MSLFDTIIFAVLGILPILTLAFAVWAASARSRSVPRRVFVFSLRWLLQCIVLALFLRLALVLLGMAAGPYDIDPASPFGGVSALLIYYGAFMGSVGFVVASGLVVVFRSGMRAVRVP